MASKPSYSRVSDFTPQVSQERIDEFIKGIYGQNRKSNNAAARKALKAVLFGVAAEAYGRLWRRG